MQHIPLLAIISGTVCFLISGYLVTQDIEGWGWFLFVGALVATAPFNGFEFNKG